ncbi:hypothetical protein BDP55DRAFT_50877 [Colletotrichum godetiae]|uniref:Uncharacterized protein n=1 Tax=Colletotrichum godetiae TaxID=1209918 RepID=A0AAJ0AV25_9PEZI|nr:uncharacterized protein BDP55DRAFT_50877 [Colletotrichum godetiae]KAK1688639.1 hypothetical protein BDP55DRAFT_50877 [Colletotrichum godetiae]
MCSIGQRVMCPGVATRAKPDTGPGRTLSPLRLGVLLTGPARFWGKSARSTTQPTGRRGGPAGTFAGVPATSIFFPVYYLSLRSSCHQLPVCRASTGIPKSAHPYPCFLASSTSAS